MSPHPVASDALNIKLPLAPLYADQDLHQDMYGGIVTPSARIVVYGKAPADSPKRVMREGSPPNYAWFSEGAGDGSAI